MSFTRQILVGLSLGVFTGLLLGELVWPLTIVAQGFVKLLQMTVLPYITVSIVSSLGALDYSEAKRLGRKAGGVLLALWSIGLLFAFATPLAFPPIETASFFSQTLITPAEPLNLVDLYIPANPFFALANNVVPAVVLFSVILGVAVIGLERKQPLIEVLSLTSRAIARATHFIVRLTPFGIFAIAASAAGTLHIAEVSRLQVYLIAYMAVAMLVALWVLPGLVAALTPIPYRAVLQPTRDALITAFLAADLFIVLPILISACKELLARYGLTDAESASLPDVLVPTSFNFPHTGKLMSLSFVLFAAWLAGAPVPAADYPRLAFAGLLTFFGSLNAAIPFLLDVFRIPADTFYLFATTSVINSRFGSLLAAVHTVALTLIGTAAVTGTLRFDASRLVRYCVTTLLLTVATLGGLRVAFETILRSPFEGEALVYGIRPRFQHPPTVVRNEPSPMATPARTTVERVRARGRLDVAVLPNSLPYAFQNKSEELVGLDVEMAHRLAADLGVGVAFIRTRLENLPAFLRDGRCDIAMSGVLMTPQRAETMRFSQPYLDETLAFMVRDHLRHRFATWDSIRRLGPVHVGTMDVPYYIAEVRERAPSLRLEALTATVDPLSALPTFEAFLVPAERGSVLTLLHPEFTIVVPEPSPVKAPLAYPLPPGDSDWASLVNGWIELKRRDGTVDALFRHWIMGQSSETRQPRWSILRNVLHWVR